MRVVMCYNKTAFTPGRFLEDGLKSVGCRVDVYRTDVDLSQIDLSDAIAAIFVDSPPLAPIRIQGADRLTIPKLLWVHHGANRLEKNLRMCRQVQPDLVLMAHSLQLADRFQRPVQFFPFGVASDIFNCSTPLEQRTWDIAFVGSASEKLYNHRRAILRAIRAHFSGRAKITLNAKVYLDKLAALYGNAKIVVNCAADELRTINMRLFEGMGCGALVLTDLVPDQERLFQDGEHYVVYQGVTDLLEKLDHYLAHLDRAQEIAARGHQHVLTHHTYAHRARGLLRIIAELSSNNGDDVKNARAQ